MYLVCRTMTDSFFMRVVPFADTLLQSTRTKAPNSSRLSRYMQLRCSNKPRLLSKLLLVNLQKRLLWSWCSNRRSLVSDHDDVEADD